MTQRKKGQHFTLSNLLDQVCKTVSPNNRDSLGITEQKSYEWDRCSLTGVWFSPYLIEEWVEDDGNGLMVITVIVMKVHAADISAAWWRRVPLCCVCLLPFLVQPRCTRPNSTPPGTLLPCVRMDGQERLPERDAAHVASSLCGKAMLRFRVSLDSLLEKNMVRE